MLGVARQAVDWGGSATRALLDERYWNTSTLLGTANNTTFKINTSRVT